MTKHQKIKQHTENVMPNNCSTAISASIVMLRQEISSTSTKGLEQHTSDTLQDPSQTERGMQTCKQRNYTNALSTQQRRRRRRQRRRRRRRRLLLLLFLLLLLLLLYTPPPSPTTAAEQQQQQQQQQLLLLLLLLLQLQQLLQQQQQLLLLLQLQQQQLQQQQLQQQQLQQQHLLLLQLQLQQLLLLQLLQQRQQQLSHALICCCTVCKCLYNAVGTLHCLQESWTNTSYKMFWTFGKCFPELKSKWVFSWSWRSHDKAKMPEFETHSQHDLTCMLQVMCSWPFLNPRDPKNVEVSWLGPESLNAGKETRGLETTNAGGWICVAICHLLFRTVPTMHTHVAWNTHPRRPVNPNWYRENGRSGKIRRPCISCTSI